MMKVPANRTYFTADTHYSHINICRGGSAWPIQDTRDFSSLDEMNSHLVNKINLKIPQDGILFHLGDWSFNGIGNIGKFRDRLNVSEIHLILGNHDHHLEKDDTFHKYFTSVQHYQEISINRQLIVLFHYGMRVWNGSHKGSWQLYGHSHGSLPPYGKSMDVGVDTNNYSPYSYTEIYNIMNKKKIEINDHHNLRD